MNTNDCDRARIYLTALADGEADAGGSGGEREHVAGCAACQTWLAEFASLSAKLQNVTLERGERELWSAVRARIHEHDREPSVPRGLWVVAGAAVSLRLLHLLVDLPRPELQPFLVLAAAVAVVWWMGRQLLAIETMAPELHGRGV